MHLLVPLAWASVAVGLVQKPHTLLRRPQQTQLGVWGGYVPEMGSPEVVRREAKQLVAQVAAGSTRVAAGLCLASGILFANPRAGYAAGARSTDTTTIISSPLTAEATPSRRTSSASSRRRTTAAGTATPSAAKAIEIVIVDSGRDSEKKIKATKSKRLTQTGLALVGINLVALLLTGDDGESTKRVSARKAKPVPRRFVSPSTSSPPPKFSKSISSSIAIKGKITPPAQKKQKDKDGDVGSSDSSEREVSTNEDDLFAPSTLKAGSTAAKFKRSLDKQSTPSLASLPPQEELFGDDADDLFSSESPAPSPSPLPSSSPSSRESKTMKVAPTAIPPPPPPPPPPAKKNILDRIFQKPGGGRPTDISAALKDETDGSHEFRLQVAHALASYVPEGLFPQLDDYALEEMRRGGREAQAEALRNAREGSGLVLQDAALAFADVTNAMLVTMVDRANQIAQQKPQKSETTADLDKATIAALDDVADFVGGAGDIFLQAVPGAVIDPVLYNGKTRKGDLETCYFRYLKESMNLQSIMGAIAPPAETAESGSAPADVDAAAATAEERAAKLGRLQGVFAIKEAKRSSLEQKAMREMFMSMAKGEGGMEGMAGLFESLGGKGGLDDNLDPAMMNEMMGAMDPNLQKEMQREMENMDPAEMAAASQEAVVQLKEALEQGTVTKKDVAELEKMMGIDVKSLAKMIDSGQVDKKKLESMGPGLSDLLDIFRELAKIK